MKSLVTASVAGSGEFGTGGVAARTDAQQTRELMLVILIKRSVALLYSRLVCFVSEVYLPLSTFRAF